MRQFYVTALFAVVALLTVAMFAGEAQAQRRGFGNAASLVGIAQVQDELKLDDEQKTKVGEISTAYRTESRALYSGLSQAERREKRDELRKKSRKLATGAQQKINAVLNEAQRTRLSEISLQLRGSAALTSGSVAKKLSLTDDQKKTIADLQTASRKEMQELFQGLRDGTVDRDSVRAKFTGLREKLNEGLGKVLTIEQRATLEKSKGKKFELDRSQLQRRRRSTT